LRRILSFLYPRDKLAAYNQGRRDQLNDTWSLIETLRLSRVIDISTGHMILMELNKFDQRPTGDRE
jgi:hypothetical protein